MYRRTIGFPSTVVDGKQTVAIVVLDDGETYGRLSGCKILLLTEQELRMAEGAPRDVFDNIPNNRVTVLRDAP